VTDYRNGEYEVRHDNPDGSISHYRWYDSSMVVEQLRTGRWWVDG
jgi:hypothetical protein